jgi:hypothetical protein
MVTGELWIPPDALDWSTLRAMHQERCRVSTRPGNAMDSGGTRGPDTTQH